MPTAHAKVNVAIGAKVAASFKSAMASADKALEGLQASVGQLNATAGRIGAFRSQATATGKAKLAWQDAQKSVASLARELRGVEKPTKAQAKAMADAQRAAMRAKQEFIKQREATRTLGRELREAGVDTRRLGQAQADLARKTAEAVRRENDLAKAIARRDTLVKKASIAAGTHSRIVDKASEARGRFAGAGTQFAVGIASVGALIRESAKFETAMLGVAKQMGGAKDQNGEVRESYANMRTAIEDLADTIPQAREEVVALAEASLRGGLGRGFETDAEAQASVIGFTKELVKMSAAIDGLSPAELGKQMSTISGIFELPLDQVSALGDSFNMLDNKTRASGADIIATTKRVAGSAKLIGLSATETAALAGTILDLGETAETGGTGLKKLFSRISTAGERTSKPFNRALRKIGLSGKQLQKDVSADALGTIFDVLERISKVRPSERSGVLLNIFGEEAQEQVAKLALNLDKVRENVGHTTSEEAKNSVNREFEAKLDSTAAKAGMARNQLMRMATTIGDALAPAFLNLLSDVKPIVESFRKWADENPETVASIVKITGALAALRLGMLATKAVGLTGASGVTGIASSLARRNAARAAAGAAATAGGSGAGAAAAVGAGAAGGARGVGLLARASGLMGSIGGWVAGLGPMIVGVIEGVVTAVAGVVGAITAPIAAIVAAIVAAIAAIAGVIYVWWNPIKAFFSGIFDGFTNALDRINLDKMPALKALWEGTSTVLSVVWTKVQALAEIVGDGLASAWGFVAEAIGDVWNWFSELLTPIGEADQATQDAAEAGRNFGDVMVSAIEFVLEVLDRLLGGLGKAIDKLGQVGEFIGDSAFEAQQGAASALDSVSSFFGFGEDAERSAALNSAGGSLARGAVAQSQTNNINVNVQNGDPASVQQGIERAMATERERARSRDRASYVGSPAF